MPSTNEPDVMAIKPNREGNMYFIKVGNMGPSRASLSTVFSVFIESY
jgi:hypothetical protein